MPLHWIFASLNPRFPGGFFFYFPKRNISAFNDSWVHDITWWLFLLNPKRLEFIVQPDDHYHDDNLPWGYSIFDALCYLCMLLYGTKSMCNSFFAETIIAIAIWSFFIILGRVPKEDEGTLYSIFCQVPGAVCKDRLWYHFLLFNSKHEW